MKSEKELQGVKTSFNGGKIDRRRILKKYNGNQEKIINALCLRKLSPLPVSFLPGLYIR